MRITLTLTCPGCDFGNLRKLVKPGFLKPVKDTLVCGWCKSTVMFKIEAYKASETKADEVKNSQVRYSARIMNLGEMLKRVPIDEAALVVAAHQVQSGAQ